MASTQSLERHRGPSQRMGPSRPTPSSGGELTYGISQMGISNFSGRGSEALSDSGERERGRQAWTPEA